MTNEEVRLRALLANRTGDVRYVKDIPPIQHHAALYPEIIRRLKLNEKGEVMGYEEGNSDEENLKKLKDRLDKELGI